jgi:hypothetical protein
MRFTHTLFPILTAVALVAACHDGPPPVAPVAITSSPAALAGGVPASDERVTITRTVETSIPDENGRDKPRKVTRRTRTYTRGAGRVAVHSASPDAPGRPRRSASAATRRDTLNVPDQLLTAPAARTSVLAASMPWTRQAPVASDPGLVVISDGEGGAPASRMRFMRNGILTATTTQTWEFWEGRWNLVHRETVTPDGSLRDVIDVKRTGRHGVGQLSSAAWARETASHGAIGAPLFDYQSDDCDQCGLQRIAVTAALEKLAAAELSIAAACWILPPPFNAAACSAALMASLVVAADADRAIAELDLCLATPCPRKPDASGSTTGGGGGGDGSGGTAPTSLVCTYYYEYDLDTGDIVYSELLSCTMQ